MYGWILHDNTEIHEIKRAADEAAKANVTIELVYPKDIDLILDNTNSGAVYVKGVKKQLPEFALAAFLAEVDYYNLAVLRQLDALGVLCINTADALLKSGDKLVTSQILLQKGIPVAKTALLRPGSDLKTIEREFGLPLVVKVLRGSKGKGVLLINTLGELKNLVELYEAGGFRDEVLIQEYIATTKGRDLRVFVCGGKALGCFMRQNAGDGFKSNISGGGHGSTHPLTDEIKNLAELVAQTLGLNIGGIDLLFGPNGFIVGEANSLPGFQGLEAATGMNIPGMILRSIAAQLASRPAARWRIQQVLAESQTIPLPQVLLSLPKTVLPGVVRSLFSSCPESQQTVLLEMVNRCQNTEFGKNHNFAAIKSIEDFRNHVPISSWPDYEAYAERLANGEENILFPGKAEYFITSSGTSSNKPKMIPESTAGAAAKKAISAVRRLVTFSLFPNLTKLGHFLALSNAAANSVTPAGIPVGFASGITRSQADATLAALDAYPPEIMDITDSESVDYLIMRFALLHKDMMAIVGNNAGRMRVLAEYAQKHAQELIDDIAAGTISQRLPISPDIRKLLEEKLNPAPERAAELRQILEAEGGAFLPKDYWPHLMIATFWLASTVGTYVDDVRPLLGPKVTYLDVGYGSSEVKINIPLKPNEPCAPLAPFIAFFEFLPVTGGEPLLAHELKDGEIYELIVTTYSGLYRYNMQDLIKVGGFTGNTPNIEFVSKSTEIANIADEKIPGSDLNQCIREIAASMGLPLRQCQMSPDQTSRQYVFLAEPETHTVDFPVEQLITEFDEAMKKKHFGYSLFRNQQLLNLPTLRLMKQGWQEHLYQQRLKPGVTIAQIKLPFIVKTLPDSTWFV
ncbi:RimK family alpha-L-glutamate ligase [Sporomusa malonica]|uniref:Alpha-L-glutamate ligase, RimK family n=1 Tax=Sporomusa malonica TaxID=112901 RepID=A0A1W1ZSG9_9FIRM|nr:RimK family alpha-L-glutamate ligase [Sporomusa malonica]SMC51008.1 alpha-L-glutamate ligase, RimK family [Sporomusa malonica]